jgi:hypothetical protein
VSLTLHSRSATLDPLIDSVLHLFLRFIKLARLPLRLDFADHFLEKLDDFEAASAFDALDVEFHTPVGSNTDVKFALGHKSGVPVPHLEVDGAVLGRLLLNEHETARADFVEQLLVDVLLHHRAAQLFTEGAQRFFGVA